MLIKYRFSINGTEVHPIYKDDLSKDYALEAQERFYRAELPGALRFVKDDFTLIMTPNLETEQVLLIEKSNDGGLTWADYFTGSFYRTDCQIDLDSQKVEVKVQTKDNYVEVLAGIEKEYDLIKLAPAKTLLAIDKRPLIQLYIPGDAVVSCFLGGNSWEQEVTEPVSNLSTLANTYKFSLASQLQRASVNGSGAFPADLTGEYVGEFSFNPAANSGPWEDRRQKYILRYRMIEDSGPFGYKYKLELVRLSDSVILFAKEAYSLITPPTGTDITLNAVSGSGATGAVLVYCSTVLVYARYLLDLDVLDTDPTYPIPTSDLVENNRNYKRVIGYNIDCAAISNRVSDTPTQYGLSDEGKYFLMPYTLAGYKFYPIARSTWGWSSIWFAFEVFDRTMEEAGRKQYILKDSMLLSDVLKALLTSIDPTITHEGTPAYSQFLYGETNPITLSAFRVMLTQKSNILAGEYDQPAKKAVTSLSEILRMLKNAMRVFWYIDADKKFRLEHVSWFKKGGSYLVNPAVSYDLTTLTQRKNQKPWGFALNKYSYDKAEMAERYEFSWMDEATEGFSGYPININSKFVQRGKIESVSVSNFTSDVDYMLLNPNEISMDGFALFGAVWDGSQEAYKLPYLQRTVDGAQLFLQNGLMSFIYLHPNFWVHDLPSYNVNINKEEGEWVEGIERRKKQKVSFPAIEDPNPLLLIKTQIGDGQIEKLSINLQSRMLNIELKYDTQ